MSPRDKKFFIFIGVLAITLLALAPLSVNAGSSGGDTEDKNFGIIFNIENTFMRYSQEGGVADIDGDHGHFSLDYTPRFELGILFYQGLGIRGRFWDYSADATTIDNGTIDVDTYYWDVEFFQQFQPTEKTKIEFALGIRQMNFNQTITETTPQFITGEFDGWGGTIGLEARRTLFYGNLYARGRFSILIGDHEIILTGTPIAFIASDSNVYQTELAFGYQFNIPIGDRFKINMNLGGEWQNWSNVALGDNIFGGIGNDDVLEDASFFGFVVGAGFEF